MRYWNWIGLLIVTVSLYGATAQAQTGMRCAQAANLACAIGTPATQDVATTWNFATGAATAFSFEGATPDAFETSVSVTDPTADRTLTIPNADSATVTATNMPCGGGTHVNNFNATTGVLTCSADTGGTPAWDVITAPGGNQALTMAAFTTTWTWNSTTGANDLVTMKDGAANTGTGYILHPQTNTTSAAKPFAATALGTANGVAVGATGVLAKIGTGSVVADNLIFGSDAQGDIALRGASVYARLGIGANNTVLHSNGTTASWAGIASGDIGPGDLANALTWNEAKTSGCSVGTPCALAAAPRSVDTALVVWRTLTLRRVAACGGVNEYTLSGANLALCDNTGIGTGADTVLITYEL